MNQNGSLSGSCGQAAADSLSVFVAEPGSAAPEGSPQPSGTIYRDGFTGSLVLQNVGSLNEEEAGHVLSRLNHLTRWVQAQQAKVLSRMQTIYEDESMFLSGLRDRDMAFSLAAEEAARILGVPTGTGTKLMLEAGSLSTTHTATLKRLETGQISYGHVQTMVEQSVGVPGPELGPFETELLGLAAGDTAAQFRVKARRLRENLYPETIVKRQRTAFETRRVCLQPDADGMSWLSAMLPAENAQTIFNQLSKAARGEQAAGDPRRVDQLRADILAELLGGHHHQCDGGGGDGDGGGGDGGGGDFANGTSSEDRQGSNRNGSRGAGCGGRESKRSDDGQGPKARTEILVLINAETLFGADDRPAELLGYGPISPETARRMAHEAAKWTPVERDPNTEEILRVGKRRKVADGLKRFLRARDGTCRFPGCRTNAVISEIDHTKPWAQGGTTDHDNLEHLCRRHHMFKREVFGKPASPVRASSNGLHREDGLTARNHSSLWHAALPVHHVWRTLRTPRTAMGRKELMRREAPNHRTWICPAP